MPSSFIARFYAVIISFTPIFCSAQSAAITPKAAPLMVFAAGDIADCRKPKAAARSKATADIISSAIEANPNAFVLTLGDHTYPVGTPEEFNFCYDPTWGQFKAQTYPSAGNHEYYSPMAYGYFRYFGDAAGSQIKSYYSFNKGAWHFVALNSNLKGDARQAQLDWLKDDLKNNPQRCTLAYWHHPVFSSGLHGNNSAMNDFWTLLNNAKADLILSGHDHHYERFAPQTATGERDDKNGMRQFVIGTGGATLAPIFWRKSNSEVSNTKTNGVLKLMLSDDSYSWEFIGVKKDNESDEEVFSDSGNDVCHPK